LGFGSRGSKASRHIGLQLGHIGLQPGHIGLQPGLTGLEGIEARLLDELQPLGHVVAAVDLLLGEREQVDLGGVRVRARARGRVGPG